MGRVQRSLCAGMLVLEAMVLFLTTPVMVQLSAVPTTVALAVGLGLTVVAVTGAALMRSPVGLVVGWAVQVAAIALGLVVPVMFALGMVFFALYAGSVLLGTKIDHERARREGPTLPS